MEVAAFEPDRGTFQSVPAYAFVFSFLHYTLVNKED
jgi:hypothetical protein